RHGIAGHTVEIVEVSWMEKPWDRSSRSITFRTPPDLGVWLVAGVMRAIATRTSTRVANSTMRTRDMGTSRGSGRFGVYVKTRDPTNAPPPKVLVPGQRPAGALEPLHDPETDLGARPLEIGEDRPVERRRRVLQHARRDGRREQLALGRLDARGKLPVGAQALGKLGDR